ncbi:hypothetical protein DL96DRAFT_611404 [Flagelloscypha sp. PMI_526]|nr:hypothetical protein DL96DRAFT_611404 [Flagelloscypha sp. PMI_526]
MVQLLRTHGAWSCLHLLTHLPWHSSTLYTPRSPRYGPHHLVNALSRLHSWIQHRRLTPFTTPDASEPEIQVPDGHFSQIPYSNPRHPASSEPLAPYDIRINGG